MRKSLKIISALAASAIIIGAFAGCGGGKERRAENGGCGKQNSSKISRIQHGAADCLAG